MGIAYYSYICSSPVLSMASMHRSFHDLTWVVLLFLLISDSDQTRVLDDESETNQRRASMISPVESQVKVLDSTHIREDDNPEKYIRGCYFTNWAQYRPGKGKYTPSMYETGLCTHILYAFGWMNENFTVRAYDPTDVRMWDGSIGQYEQVTNLRKTDADLKVLLSIGGWTFGTKLFEAMAATSERRATFIQSAVGFVRKWKFDGLDIDWEYPVGHRNAYTALIQELRAAFEKEAAKSGNERLLLSAAVSAADKIIPEAYDVPAIAPLFDFVLLMSYDFHGAWETKTGMNAPLYKRADDHGKFAKWNLDSAATVWVEAGMPKHKIVAGMPMYGRGWTLQDVKVNGLQAPATGPARKTEYIRSAGVASYYELCNMLENGAVRHFDNEEKVPYLVKGDQWFSYDDEESITAKMRWIKENSYGGAFAWTLDFDDFNMICTNSTHRFPLLNLIREELQ